MLRRLELDWHDTAAALLGVPAAGEVDNDMAHDARREIEEVGPVGRLGTGRTGEPEIGLVDQRGGVEGPPGPAMHRELNMGESLQLRVDALVERRGGAVLAATRRGDQRRDVGRPDVAGLFFGHEKGLYSSSGAEPPLSLC